MDLTKALLDKRGIKNKEEQEKFLNPDYLRDLHDPFLMRDMEKACERIFKTIENKEKIVVYADYDCDGIPGAVILQDLFRQIGYKNFEIYIPQRNSEGYGLNSSALKQFKERGIKLVVTVDLGITAVDEVKQAKKDGMDIIITDHHIPPKILPKACAILNPKVDDYPDKMLCGAGVAFKLVQGFLKKYGEHFKVKNGWEKWLLDMAGLATLSDRVPLLGENRVIAYFGMIVLRKSPRAGLQKLLRTMNIDQRYLSEDDIGYMLAPRLNAASRMSDPMQAFKLLSTDDEAEAGAIAEHLSKINDERKTIVTSIMREVHKKFSARGAATAKSGGQGSAFGGEEPDSLSKVIVIGNPSWKVGVLGLVAGKICDQYKKPVFVWGKDENDCIKGSCRSDGSVSLVELMTLNQESFLDFGGHELAGGFTVHTEKIHFLEETLSSTFKKVERKKEADKAIFDIESGLDLVNMKAWKEIKRLAPFGFGNPKPIFSFPGVKIEKVKKFGKNGSGEHLEIIFSDVSSKKATAISFFSGLDSFKTPINEGKTVNLLATFDLSRFRGREELRLRIVDIFKY